MHKFTKLMIAGAFTLGTFFGLLAPMTSAHGTSQPPCQEDEVLAVKVDHDPTHGLTWECVNSEEYVTTYSTPWPH